MILGLSSLNASIFCTNSQKCIDLNPRVNKWEKLLSIELKKILQAFIAQYQE